MLLVAVVLAVCFGLWRALTDGRFRGTHRVRGVSPGVSTGSTSAGGVSTGAGEGAGSLGLPDGVALGELATLLQFSSAFCAPCRAARRVLGEVADAVPGVAHVEIDAESHLDLVRRVGILRTPTTLVLDARGREVTRAAGVPRKEQVLAALADAAGEPD